MFHEAIWERFHALPSWVQTLVVLALVYVAGRIVIRIGLRALRAFMRRDKHFDVTLEKFLMGVANATAWAALILVLMIVAGVNVSALLGGIAIGGFVIGFAVKDTLGNLAAGVVLQFNRPIKVGETVEISGHTGEVTAIGMALTSLKAADARIITVPNGSVLGSAIVNHTRADQRRADVLVGIGYDDDIDVAVKAILEEVGKDPRVLADPAPSVRITDLGDNAVGLQVRPWVATKDLWQAKADLHQTVKRALDDAGCSIPYPQRDVHMIAAA